MSVLSNNLRSGETVILEAKVHWATLILPALLVIPTSGIALLWLIPRGIAFFTTELSLSNKRLVGKIGLINTKSMDSPLNKINSVSLESGILGKVFGYGTLVVNTASTTYNFKNIQNATSIKAQIFNEMEQYEETRIQEQAQSIANAISS